MINFYYLSFIIKLLLSNIFRHAIMKLQAKGGIDMNDLFNPDHLKVPTVVELKKDAERLLKSVIRFAKANRRCKFYMTATGPFKASYRYGIIELECIFTSWSCD